MSAIPMLKPAPPPAPPAAMLSQPPSTAGDMPQVLSALTSKSRLERDRAVALFRRIVTDGYAQSHGTDMQQIQQTLIARLQRDEPWYSMTSAVGALSHILSTTSGLSESDDLHQAQYLFIAALQNAVPILVAHHEARVRESGVALIAALAKQAPESTWTALSPMLFVRADETFSLDVEQRAAEASRIAAHDVGHQAGDAKTKNAQTLLHETEGWRGLETTLLTQAALTRHSSPYCVAAASLPDLITCAARARPHPNRFVREAGLHLLDAIAYAAAVECYGASEQDDDNKNREMNGRPGVNDITGIRNRAEENCDDSSRDVSKLISIATTTLPSLREGLQDNWSQVRFAACVATRTLLLSLPVADRETLLFPELLPRLCLNRHYVAEGVKSYSHETWRLLFSGGGSNGHHVQGQAQGQGQGGRPWLTKLLPQVVSFFAGQIQASNHAVREAACQSFGELATRMPRAVIRPHAASIALALRDAFKDESWPVRDHACGALADVLHAFATEVQQAQHPPSVVDLSELHALFARHLADNIASVRRNCAAGFVRAVASFPDSHPVMGFSRLRPVLTAHLAAIREQRNDTFAAAPTTTTTTTTTSATAVVDRSTASSVVGADALLNGGRRRPSRWLDSQFGASSKLAGAGNRATRLAGAQALDDAHTNQTMYSCGSLAPKLRRGGGCSDHGFVRPREQWEITEGGILLWEALATYHDDGDKNNDEKVRIGGNSVNGTATSGCDRGADARAVAQSLIAEVVSTALATRVRTFRCRPKLLVTLLDAIMAAVQNGIVIPTTTTTTAAGVADQDRPKASPNDGDTLKGLVRFINGVEKDELHVVRAKAKECRRIVMRAVGLRQFNAVERAL